MKKLKIVSLVLGLSVIFAACSNGGGDGDGIPKTTNLSIQADNVIEITPDNLVIDVPAKYQNKNAFLLALNNTDKTINVLYDTENNSVQNNKEFTSEPKLPVSKYYSIPAKLPLVNEKLTVKVNASRAAESETPPVEYNEGDTKDFYGITSSNTFEALAADAELKVIGKHCRIWYKAKTGIDLVDKNGLDATDDTLQTLADKFDSIFEKETYLFGSNIPTLSFNELIDFSKCDKIEIVVYDLLDNYKEEESFGGGIYGYFTETDFYKQEFIENESSGMKGDISNECEALHIDSFWLSKTPDAVVSTIAHEFQHLLHCVNKTVNSGGRTRSQTWFNEMLSMVCEDIMQSQLELSDEDSPKKRLPFFNINQFYGFTTWRDTASDDDIDVYYSYANSYVFGAYLLRNYGIDFIKTLAQSSYVDKEAITKALIEVGANEKSFDEVFSNYYNVILNPEGDKYTLNREVSKTYTINGNPVTFKCDAINLMDVKTISTENITEDYADQVYGCEMDEDFYGPVLLDGYFYKKLGPQGMFATFLGKGDSGYDFGRLKSVNFTSDIGFYVVFVD